jgi:hypothetical protein
MSVETTTSYIKHRLQVSGAKRMLYAAEAIPLIHRYAGGVPRLINTICDNCLFEAFMRKLGAVDARIVHSVAGDLGLLQRPLAEISQPQSRDELGEIENMLDRLELRQ